MNSQEPYRLSNIDLSNIVYTNIKQTDTKKIILIKYQDKNKLRNFVFQTPTLLNINEPKLFLKDDNGYGEIEVALYNTNNNKINKLLNFFKDLSHKITSDAKEHSDWFDNTSPIQFQKIVRRSDTFKNGTIKLKLLKNNNFETIIQKNNKQKIKMDMLTGNTLVKILLEVYAIWINQNNDYGVFLRPILVSCNKDSYNYKFIPDSDDEDDDDDIPDTEINNNIFIKSNNKDYDETSSNIEYNPIVSSNTSESNDLNNNNKILEHKDTTLIEEKEELYKNDLDINDLSDDDELNIDNIKLNVQNNELEKNDEQTNDVIEKPELTIQVEDELSDNDDIEKVLNIKSGDN
jgi:hypothetical protein